MDSKVCSLCGEDKPLTEYYKKLDKHQARCKQCDKEQASKWYKENKPRAKARMRQRWVEKREEYLEGFRRHYEENRELYAAKAMKYYASKAQATPQWADKEAIEFVYYCQRVLKEVYGVTWHVDHIVPLNGDNVCGLHVAENLQLLTPEENTRKGNRHDA